MLLKLIHTTLIILFFTGCFLAQTPANPPRFLRLPFTDSTIRMQQGWLYSEGRLHKPRGGFDYIKGSVGSDPSTWQSFDVVAAADGVAMWDSEPGYGNLVFIRHNQTNPQGRHYFTLYAHFNDGAINPNIPKMSRFNTNYDKWYKIRAGEFIGFAGSTGWNSCVKDPTKCIHLHFEVQLDKYYGEVVDPYDISRAGAAFYTRTKYPGGPGFSGCGPSLLWTACPSVSSSTVFYSANSPDIFFQEPIVDTQGNLIFITNHKGGGIRLNSVSLNGKQNWQVPNNGAFISSQSRGNPVLGPNNIIYVPALDGKLFAFASNGTQIWNASVSPPNSTNWQFPRTSPVIVDFDTGLVYASVIFTQGAAEIPNRIIAINPDGSEKWQKDHPNHARNGAAGNLIQGPERDIYTFLFTNTTALFTRLDKLTGRTVCTAATPLGSDRAGGDEEGVFTDDGKTEIHFFGSVCVSLPIYKVPTPGDVNSERNIEFRKYYQGKIFAIDYPINSFDPNQARLLVISKYEGLLWSIPDIIPSLTEQPVRVIKNNIAYVLGFDRTDNNIPKLFLVDLQNGTILSKFNTSSICGISCGIAVSDDKRIYISYGDRIYKLTGN